MKKYYPKQINFDESIDNKCYIIGDVHGCFYTLEKLIEDQINPDDKDTIIFLGDLINRGKRSKKVLDYISTLMKEFNIILIKGNHEVKYEMAIDCGDVFFENFLNKYNSYDILKGDIQEYKKMIEKMELCLLIEKYVLSHIGFNDKNSTPYTDTRSLFSRIEIDLDISKKTQIVGHTIKSKKEIEFQVRSQKNWIYLDNGCVYEGENDNYGSLCCLELRHNRLIFQENID